ncbi:MAG: hypothetical protein LBH98_09135 [Chitinispirillales bacterium]|jgi:hypothetical protein|nr:hypothetical protein [Chitinispirillales bacterium]
MSIKKELLIKLAVSVVAISLISCGGGKNERETAPTTARGGFQGHAEDICQVRDDVNFFRAAASANGPYTRRDFIKRTAISNAQSEIRQRISHLYEGVIMDYGSSIGINAGTDIDERVRAGGNQIILRMINDASIICGPKFSDVDEKGHLEVVLAIEISRKNISDELLKHVESVVSQDERKRVMLEESNFREQMGAVFQRFTRER